MKVDWLQLYNAARRANLAYELDPAKSSAGFFSLGQGLTWLGIYQNGSHQAVVCTDDKGEGYLSISGTRFKTDPGDLLDDVSLLSHDLGDGVEVTRGAFEGLDDMWEWADSFVDPSTVWHVCGHSLGAWRTRYTPVFLPPERIGSLHSFESPKGANAAYWNKYQQQLAGMISVVNERDLFVSWPFLSFEGWEHPQMLPVVWLQGSSYSITMPHMWPGGRDVRDHSMDVVEARLKVLAGL